MDFCRRKRWTTAAFAVVLAIGVASTTVSAQAPPAGQGAPARGAGAAGAPGGGQGRGRAADPNAGAPYTPAAGAKDLRAVLFNWFWGQGMLKGTDERDMVAMLEYQAKGGTIQVDGQPCTLSKFRASTNYQTLSQRVNYTCTRPNKQTYSNIEVVSWQYAWNEDTPGAEIAGTKGKIAAMPAAVQERPHSHLGQSAGRAEIGARRDDGHLDARRQPGHGDRRRRNEGWQHVGVV
jgi:hypothetical protein